MRAAVVAAPVSTVRLVSIFVHSSATVCLQPVRSVATRGRVDGGPSTGHDGDVGDVVVQEARQRLHDQRMILPRQQAGEGDRADDADA